MGVGVALAHLRHKGRRAVDSGHVLKALEQVAGHLAVADAQLQRGGAAQERRERVGVVGDHALVHPAELLIEPALRAVEARGLVEARLLGHAGTSWRCGISIVTRAVPWSTRSNCAAIASQLYAGSLMRASPRLESSARSGALA